MTTETDDLQKYCFWVSYDGGRSHIPSYSTTDLKSNETANRINEYRCNRLDFYITDMHFNRVDFPS